MNTQEGLWTKVCCVDVETGVALHYVKIMCLNDQTYENV